MTDREWETHARAWAEQAAGNVDRWGDQSVETLLLATQEELGELAQAHLEARDEDGDRERVADELDDLAALTFQLRWSIEAGDWTDKQ